jgi:hypothetical protein
MPIDDQVPEADAAEQREEVETSAPVAGAPQVPADADEADVQEQAQVVEVDQRLEPAPRSAETPEADWLEQSVAEPLDDDRR